MSFVPDEACGWRRSCKSSSDLPTLEVKDLINKSEYYHDIKTDIYIDLCGVTIPVVVTDRTWRAGYEEKGQLPGELVWHAPAYCWCSESRAWGLTSYAKEDCSIKRSTLYYLDHRYNICLYRVNTETFAFDIKSDDYALFKDPYGTERLGKIRLKDDNYTCTGKEEFFLVSGGEHKKLFESEYRPVAELKHMASGGSDILFDENYTPDEHLELILTIPTVSSSDVIPWEDELRYNGYYSYRGPVHENPQIELDGGFRDYFYPQWCRELQSDPVWKRAAADRFYLMYETDQGSYSRSFEVTQPMYHPYPVGNHVYAGELGDVYQFLLELRNGSKVVVSSHDFDAAIKKALPEELRNLTGTSLYYPFGV